MVGRRRQQPTAVERARILMRNWGRSRKAAQTPTSSAVDQPVVSIIMNMRKYIFPTRVKNTARKQEKSCFKVDLLQPSSTILVGPDFKNMVNAPTSPKTETTQDNLALKCPN